MKPELRNWMKRGYKEGTLTKEQKDEIGAVKMAALESWAKEAKGGKKEKVADAN